MERRVDVLLFEAAAAVARPAGDPVLVLEVAMAAVRAGAGDVARPLLRALEGVSQRPGWLAPLAAAWAMLGEGDEARRLAALAPEAHDWLATTCEWLDDDAGAEAHLVAADDTTRLRSLEILVGVDVQRRRFDRALELAGRLPVESDPGGRADAFLAVARALSSAGERARAEAALALAEAAADRVEPPYGQRLAALGVMQGELGHPDQALRLARRAAETVPRKRSSRKKRLYAVPWHGQVARAFALGGDDKEARAIRETFEEIAAGGADAPGFASAARFHAEAGAPGDARRLVAAAERALERRRDGDSSDRDSAHAKLVSVRIALEEIAPAIRHAAAIEAAEDRVRALLEIARWCAEHPPEATPEVEAAIAELRPRA